MSIMRPLMYRMSLVISCLCTVWNTQAQPLSSLRITADDLSIDNHTRIAIFTGHVSATHPRIQMTGQQLTVHYTPQHLTQLICTGHPVTFHLQQQQHIPLSGTAQRIHYDWTQSQLTMTGHVLIDHGREHISANSVIYDLAHDRCHILSKQEAHHPTEQVQIIVPLQPEKS